MSITTALMSFVIASVIGVLLAYRSHQRRVKILKEVERRCEEIKEELENERLYDSATRL